MLTPDQIVKRAHGRYVDVLRSIVRQENIFPIRILGAGVSRIADFEQDRRAIQMLRTYSKEKRGFGYEIEWKRQTFRSFGLQDMPVSIAITSREDFARLVDKCDELQAFDSNQRLIRDAFPELLGWIEKKPLSVIDHASEWHGLLRVCRFLRDNGRPDCYLRELPVGVDTKFIERNKSVLSELLPIVAPNCMADDSTSFETRFGFRQKQQLIRFRLLDPALMPVLQVRFRDFAIPLDEVITLCPHASRVIVVENEITFLTLPFLPNTIAILGSGDAAAQLRRVQWLSDLHFVYWGDIDAHGFETLSILRDGHRKVRSVMMDLETFAKFRHFAVAASPFGREEKLNLTSEEQDIFKIVVCQNLLLEQERLPTVYVEERLRESCGQT